MKRSHAIAGGAASLLALYLTVQPRIDASEARAAESRAVTARSAAATTVPARTMESDGVARSGEAHAGEAHAGEAPAGHVTSEQASVALASTELASAGMASVGEASARSGQTTTRPSDQARAFVGRERFDSLVRRAEAENWRSRPIGEVIAAVGMQLRGTPYVASTLELDVDREFCSINLLGLDCVTFFESSLDFARMLKKGENTPEAMMAQVTHTRYRDGRVGDYSSRLHYTSDWFYDNEAKRVVKNITRELPGAERFTKTIDFMSTHPDAYRQLKAHPELLPKIKEIEARINKRTMYYVPKEKVAQIEPLLKTGDIIGITTSIPGIDCSHTGMVYRDSSGELRYLHASSTKKQVWLDDRLSTYLAGVTKHTGIMVARAIDVK